MAGRKLAGQRKVEQARAIERRWVRIVKLEAMGIAKELIEDPVYLEMLKKKMHRGTLHPQLQVMLWGYGYGKPHETVEVRKKIDVRIVHEYDNAPVTPVGVGVDPNLPDIDIDALPLALPPHES